MYCSISDLQQRFDADELLDLAPQKTDPTKLDMLRLSKACADAAEEIDSYAGRRYTLPIASCSAVLTGYACDIARYRLHTDRMPENVRKRYEDALKWLADVAAGRVVLVGAELLNAATPGGSVVVKQSTSVFNRVI